MKQGWEIKHLGDVCEFVRGPFGGSLKKSIFKQSGYAVYEQQHAIYNQFSEIRYFIDENKFEEMKRFELRPNDLIMSCSGTMGKVAIVPDNIAKGIINQALLKLTCKSELNVDYLKLWMDSAYFIKELEKNTVGAAIKNVASVKVLKTIQLPIPSLPEQQRIVSILDETFSAIDKAKANVEQNLKNAKELFESYLQGVFEKKGDGWEERKLGDSDLLKIIDGDRGKNYPRKKDFLDEGHCLFMNTKNVRPDGFEFETTMFISEAKDKAMGKGKLKRNDVVMTTRGTIGNLGVYDDSVEFENIRINSGMLIFRPNTKVITPHYLFETFRSGVFKAQIKKYTTGAAQPQLPIKTLVNFTIPVPITIEAQQSIVRQLDALRAETQKLEAVYQKKIDDLEELKKSILQKAFKGELRSPEGVASANDGYSPSEKKTKNKISPERA